MVRAKELLKSDRKAAAEEAKRIKELQAQHNRLKEVTQTIHELTGECV